MPNSTIHQQERRSAGLLSILVDPHLGIASRAHNWPMTFIEVPEVAASSRLNERALSKIDAVVLSDASCTKPGPLSSSDAVRWAERSDHLAAKCISEMILARTGGRISGDSDDLPIVYLVPPDSAQTAIEGILTDIITAHVARLERWLDLTLRERTALREETEDLHEALADMQTALADLKDTRSLAYEASPSETAKAIGDLPLVQRLPCLARGICDIELHCPAPTESGSPAHLMVELLEFETKTVLFEWTRPAGDLTQGWNRFTIPMALICKRFNACLRVSATEPGITLSMGEITAVAKAALRPIETGGDARPIAIKVWRALPGTIHVQPADFDEHGAWTRFLPSVYNGLKLMLPRKASAAYPLFEARPTAFQLHPWKNTVSIIGAAVTLPPKSARIRIRATLSDKRSRHVDVAAGLIANRTEDILDPAELGLATCFSQWKTLRAEETTEITVALPGTLMQGLLFFAVRMHDPMGGSDYSGTEWTALELLQASGQA